MGGCLKPDLRRNQMQPNDTSGYSTVEDNGKLKMFLFTYEEADGSEKQFITFGDNESEECMESALAAVHAVINSQDIPDILAASIKRGIRLSSISDAEKGMVYCINSMKAHYYLTNLSKYQSEED